MIENDETDWVSTIFGCIAIVFIIIVGIICALNVVGWDHSSTTITIKEKIPTGYSGLSVVTTDNLVFNVIKINDYAKLDSNKTYLVEIAHNPHLNPLNGGIYNIDGVIKEV